MDIGSRPLPPTSTPSPRRRGRTAVRVAAVAAVAVATAAVATGAFGPATPVAAADGLKSFEGCDAVRDWYVDALRPLVTAYGVGWSVVMEDTAGGAEGAAVASSPEARDGGGADAAVGSGATGTNLQEAGVDEPDVMKSSDGVLVTTVGDRVVVLDVSGGAPRQLGSLRVENLGAAWGAWPLAEETLPAEMPAQPGTAELLLDGDRVVLLSSGWAATEGEQPQQDRLSIWPGPTGTATTTTTVVDIGDPAAPRLVSQQEIEGSLVGARLSDGVVRVVTTSTPTLPGPASRPRVLPNSGIDPRWEDEATQANLLALERMAGEDFLPAVITRDADGAVVGRAPALGCTDIAHPSAVAGGGAVTVRSFDLGRDDDPVVDVAAVAADGDLVYASTDRLYVATTRGGWMRWSADGRPLEDEGITTELHGFVTDRGAATTYLASGEVDGFLLGRWAMSARDGRLRVATTTGQPWAGPQGQEPQSQSAVTVLSESGDELVQEGQVTGLGPGETIRSVRWFEDVAVVVTFRQTDPLYVVDLSDPAAPAVRGELKVPGYSAYLHPVGAGRLVGVGQDATEEGQTTGVLVQTFDISDPAAPTQVDTWTERGSWTSVEHDSRQFTFVPERRLVVMPMDTMNGSAVQAFSVGQDGALEDAGRFLVGSQQRPEWLVRAMPVGDAVAVLSSGEQGGSLTMLQLDGLSATGSTSLG